MPLATIIIRQGDSNNTPGSRDDLVLNQTVTVLNNEIGVTAYFWQLIDKPAGSSAVLTTPTHSISTFIPDIEGTYLIQLVINNGALLSRAGAAVKTANLHYRIPAALEDTEFDPVRGWANAMDFVLTTLDDGYGNLLATGGATTGVIPGSYTNTNLTVDAYGRLTAASNGPGSALQIAYNNGPTITDSQANGPVIIRDTPSGSGGPITSDTLFQVQSEFQFPLFEVAGSTTSLPSGVGVYTAPLYPIGFPYALGSNNNVWGSFHCVDTFIQSINQFASGQSFTVAGGSGFNYTDTSVGSNSISMPISAHDFTVSLDDGVGNKVLNQSSTTLPAPYSDVGVLLQSTQAAQTTSLAVDEGAFVDINFPATGAGTFTIWNSDSFTNQIFAVQNNTDPTQSSVSIAGQLNVDGYVIATGPSPTIGQALIFDGTKYKPTDVTPPDVDSLQASYNGGNTINLSSFTPISLFSVDTSPAMALTDVNSNVRWLFHGDARTELFATPVDGFSTFISNAPVIQLNGAYWNGSFSTTTQAQLGYIVDNNSPLTTHFEVNIDSFPRLQVFNSGLITGQQDIVAGRHLGFDGYTLDASSGANIGDVLEYNGTSFVPTTPAVDTDTLQSAYDGGTSPNQGVINLAASNPIQFNASNGSSVFQFVDTNFNAEIADASFSIYDNFVQVNTTGVTIEAQLLSTGAFSEVSVGRVGSIVLETSDGGSNDTKVVIDPTGSGFDVRIGNLSKFRVTATPTIIFNAPVASNFTSTAAANDFDWSSSSGAFKTSTGAATFNGSSNTFLHHIVVDGYTIDNSGGATSGQALIYNGTSFIPTTPTVHEKANASETQLTTTGATDVLDFTTANAGNYMVYVYWRVVTATTNLGINITYTDVTGAQTQVVLASATPQTVGSYTGSPVFINATSGTHIKLTCTAGTANQVFISGAIIGIT